MVSLLVFTPEPLLQLAVSQVIEKQIQPAIRLAGIVSCLSDLGNEVALHQPQVAIVAVFSGMDWEVLKTIRHHSPGTKLVVWGDNVPAEIAFELMEFGLRGIVRRNVTPESLLECIEKVHEGELCFEKSFTDSMLSSRKVKLSRRESELVQLLTQGLKNKEIAWSMKISEGTVKVYLSKLFAKTGAKDRLEMALIGLKHLPYNPPMGSHPSTTGPHSLLLGTKTGGELTGHTTTWDQHARLVS